VKIFGIGIYEKHPNGGDFTLGYRFYIEEPVDGAIASQSELFEEVVEQTEQNTANHIVWHKFQNYPGGVLVKAGQKFNFVQWMNGERCYYSESGEYYRQIPNEDKDLFTIQDS